MPPPRRRSPGAEERELSTRRKPPLELVIRPLTAHLWPALEDLFGRQGACNGCWCMYWRIGSEYRQRASGKNRAAFRQIVKRGPPPGLLAFDGDVAVGWCQLTPRAALPWLDRAWRLRRVDAAPVWCISCFYVRKGYRRRGVTAALIAAAVRAARRTGTPALEAYPLDGDLTPSASGTGYASTFARAGFKTVARHVPPRPIMRLDLVTHRRGPRSSGGCRRVGQARMVSGRRGPRSIGRGGRR